jgi:hypothetical protein
MYISATRHILVADAPLASLVYPIRFLLSTFHSLFLARGVTNAEYQMECSLQI